MYHFGVGTGKVPSDREKALNQIAEKHDASFIAADMPEGPRYWFVCQNYGAPFDEATAKAVLAEAEENGLWPLK